MLDKHISIVEVPKMWLYHVKKAIEQNWLNVVFDAPFVLSGALMYYIKELSDKYEITVGEYDTKQITTFTLDK